MHAFDSCKKQIYCNSHHNKIILDAVFVNSSVYRTYIHKTIFLRPLITILQVIYLQSLRKKYSYNDTYICYLSFVLMVIIAPSLSSIIPTSSQTPAACILFSNNRIFLFGLSVQVLFVLFIAILIVNRPHEHEHTIMYNIYNSS